MGLTLLFEITFGSPEGLTQAEHITAWNATMLLIMGAAISLRRSSTPRAVYIPSLLMVVAVACAAVLIPVAHHVSFANGPRMLAPAIGSSFLVIFLGGGVVKWGSKAETDMVPMIAAALSALWLVCFRLSADELRNVSSSNSRGQSEA
jgi:hypothetical protein